MRAYLPTALYRAPRPTKTAMIVYKIGVNINQIAKKINETGQIHAKDIKELQEMMDAIWCVQKCILSEEP